MPDSMLAEALSPSISMTNVLSVRGGRFLPGSNESRVGDDATVVGVAVVKMPHPPGGAFIGSGGLGGGGRAAGITVAGLGNLLRRLALASGSTIRKEALPL